MITIIDYGLGNLGSVKNALDRLGISSIVSNDPIDLKNSNGLILPGVGAAGEGMKNITELGLVGPIIEEVKKGKPTLGICLGMQLMMGRSDEGDINCLDLIRGGVEKFKSGVKVPQIGWNTVLTDDKTLFKGVPSQSYFYFVHSYYCRPSDSTDMLAKTEYGVTFCSGIRRDNIYGVQFHPEKSGENGLLVLKNFNEIVYGNNTGN